MELKLNDETKLIEKNITPLLKEMSEFQVNNAEDVEQGSLYLRKIKDAEIIIEDKRLEFTKPLNQSLKAINDTFKAMKEPLAMAKAFMSGKILMWKKTEDDRIRVEQARIDKLQEEARIKAEEEYTKLDLVAPEIVVEPVVIAPVANKIGNVQSVKRWKWRLVSFVELSDAYKMTNDSYINQKIREGVRDIKGIEIYQEESLSII